MSIFQLLAVLFALFMMFIVQIHHKKRTLNISEASLWYSVWLLFIVIAVFPNLVQGIADSLKFTRVFDFLIVCSFVILSLVTFTNYFTSKKLDDKIERMIRDEALRSATQRSNGKTKD